MLLVLSFESLQENLNPSNAMIFLTGCHHRHDVTQPMPLAPYPIQGQTLDVNNMDDAAVATVEAVAVAWFGLIPPTTRSMTSTMTKTMMVMATMSMMGTMTTI